MTRNEMVPETHRKQRAVTCNEDDIGSRERMTRDDRKARCCERKQVYAGMNDELL